MPGRKGVAEEFEDGEARGEGLGVPAGAWGELGEDDLSYGDGVVACLRGKLMDGDFGLLERSGFPYPEVAGVGVDQAGCVEEGVVIRIVDGATAEEFGDERGLAGAGGAGEEDGSALPGDHAGMEEDAVGGVNADVEKDLMFQAFEQGGVVIGEQGEDWSIRRAGVNELGSVGEDIE